MDFNTYQKVLSGHFSGQECAFSPQEYAVRIASVRQRMEARNLGSLLVTDPSDVFYLTGYSTFEVSVHIALVVSPSSLTLQVPSIETGPATITTRVTDILGYRWESLNAVLDPLADVLRREAPRVGVDAWHGSLRKGVIEGLQSRLPDVEFEDCSDILKSVRIVKSDAELENLRASARITGQGIAAAAGAVKAGVSDNDIAAIGAQALIAAGSEFMSMQPIVTTGARSSVIHTNHKRVTVASGEPVFLEFGASFNRYTAPMMRTLVAGTPSAHMRRVFDGCQRIVDELCRAMKPGNSFDAAAQAGEKALAPLVDDVFFSGVFGYTVGAQFPPSWVEGSGYIARGETRVFEPNMVFHLPICLRVPGHWGIGSSETVMVTADGAEPLTENPWRLD